MIGGRRRTLKVGRGGEGDGERRTGTGRML